MSEFSPLNHYVYPVLDVECTCSLCSVWRTQRDAFDEIKTITFNHQRSCMCWRCRRRRQLQQGFLAAASKRELYCEMSWHASRHPKSYGPQLMDWVRNEIVTNSESAGWWATFGQAYPISYWLARFQSAAYGPAAIDEEVEEQPKVWCGWCGDDMFDRQAEFCSDQCAADHAASMRPKVRRVYLPDDTPRQKRERVFLPDDGFPSIYEQPVRIPAGVYAAYAASGVVSGLAA